MYQQLDRSGICKQFVKSYAIWPDFDTSFLGPWSVIYNLYISIQQGLYEYIDFKRIDYNLLLQQLENINWDQIYSYNDVNDQMRFLQENVKFLYKANVPIKTRRVAANQTPGLPLILRDW